MTTFSKSLILGSITAILYYAKRVNAISGILEAKTDDWKGLFFADSSALNLKAWEDSLKEKSKEYNGLYWVSPYSVEEALSEPSSTLIARLLGALYEKKFHHCSLARLEMALRYEEMLVTRVRVIAAIRTAPTRRDWHALVREEKNMSEDEKLLAGNFPFVTKLARPGRGENYVLTNVKSLLKNVYHQMSTDEVIENIEEMEQCLQSREVLENWKENVIQFLLWKIYQERVMEV